MLHSGSRGVGNVIGRYFISRVQKEMGNLLRRLPHKDLAEQTGGVECQKDRCVIDKMPSAYKDIDTVMNNQSDLVEVVHTLKPVVCVKG